MALDDSARLEMIEMLRTADGGELMRRLAGGMLQAGVDAEATAHIGAGVHQRTEARTTQRNSTRDKVVMTAAGDLTVKIAEVRTGSFFPARSAKAANTCQPTRPGRVTTTRTRTGRRDAGPPGRSRLVRPTTSRRPTPNIGSQCEVSRLALDVEQPGIPEPAESHRPGRTQPPERPWRAPLWATGPQVVRFRAPGTAADQNEGGRQDQHDAGVDAKFEQDLTQCAGGFIPGQGQSGTDGEDLLVALTIPMIRKGWSWKPCVQSAPRRCVGLPSR